jgi:hypothetical protein
VKPLWRILISLAVALALLVLVVTGIFPVALSFYAAHKAPAIARIVPTEISDHSLSKAPGVNLSYFGYEFEIPWNDLDENQTKLYPADKATKNRADLHFRSGLRLLFTAIPPREWVNGVPTQMKVAPEVLESTFGHETMRSDYDFVKALYEFTPAKMNHWHISQGSHNRDEFLLMMKSIALPKAAESGIFRLQNGGFKGFQQGDPAAHEANILVDLYSDEGSVDFILSQKDRTTPITQAEVNRMIQSLHRVPQRRQPHVPVDQ